MPERLELLPRGPFSLRAAAEFGFGPNAGRPAGFDGSMRLAFPLDGGRGYAGMVLRQEATDGPVAVELHASEGADEQVALAQGARVLSLDHDGLEFLEVGQRDPVIGALQRAHPGQRPVLFHSPYEAAAWSIISARRPAAQGARIRAELSETLGTRFELDGTTVPAFPQPERLLELEPDGVPGLNPEKVTRLRGVAEAALGGDLDVDRLHRLGPERAYEEVQRLKGIGPFYAGLIVLRASGFADAMLAAPEPKSSATSPTTTAWRDRRRSRTCRRSPSLGGRFAHGQQCSYAWRATAERSCEPPSRGSGRRLTATRVRTVGPIARGGAGVRSDHSPADGARLR